MPRSDGSIIIDTKLLSDGFSKSVDGLKKSAAGAGRAIGVGIGVATVALGGFAFAAAKAAEEDAALNARTQQVAESMGLFGKEAGKVSDRLNDLATKTALATGVDDGIIKTTQAKLLTFAELAKTADEVGGSFDRATNAAIDLAAAGFGTADANAVQLGKALQDPVKGLTALARSGVTFTAAEKERIEALVESNKLGEAQEIILKAIEKQVGGTAKATAKNSERMKVAFGEMTEAAGGPLLAAFDALAPSIIGALDKAAPVLEETFGGLVDLFSGGSGAGFTSGLTSLLDMMVTGIEAAIPGVVSAFAGILQAVIEVVPRLLPVLLTALQTLITTLVPMLPGIMLTLVNAMVDGLKMIVDMLPTIVPALIDGLIALLNALAVAIPELAPVLIDMLFAIQDVLIEAIPTLVPALTEAMVALGVALATKALPRIIVALYNGWLKAGPKLVSAINQLNLRMATKAMELKGKLDQAVAKALASVLGKLNAEVSKWTNVGKQLVSGLWAGISGRFDWLVAQLRSFASNVTDRLKAFFKIKSPSRLIEAEVGYYLGAALATPRGFGRGMSDSFAAMRRSVSGELGRFGVSVAPTAASAAGSTVVNRGGDTIVFSGPVRTYSEVVRAKRDIDKGLAW